MLQIVQLQSLRHLLDCHGFLTVAGTMFGSRSLGRLGQRRTNSTYQQLIDAANERTALLKLTDASALQLWGVIAEI
jgi:hypothetical protein